MSTIQAGPATIDIIDFVKPHFLDNYQVENDALGGGCVIKMMLRLTYTTQSMGGVEWNMGDVREVRCWSVVALHELINQINAISPGSMKVREDTVDLRIYGVPVDAVLQMEVGCVGPKA